VEKFGEIADQNLERFQLDSIPFDDRSFGKLFKVLPVKDLKKLELTWILPNKKQHYRHHPGLYISSLIGHEGKGSILSYLIREGLASTLSCGNQDTFNSFTELEISIGLTEKGLSQINQIVGYILFYIKMLREGECPRWFFEELQLINNLKFQFMDKKKGMAEASSLAKHLQERQVEELLVYPYLMDEWRPDLIKEYLNELRLDNLIILCQAKKFEAQCDLEEPVYSTRYCIEKVLDLKELECDVSLPENNVFLPKDLTVLAPEEERLPIQVCKSDFVDAFFKKDHRFGLPKVDVNIRLVFDGSFSAVADITRTIFLEMFKESVREFVYLANMAEIKVRNSFVSYISLEMNFKGFKDSLKLFLVEYLRRLLEFRPIDAQLFANLVDNNRRKYANSLLDVPYTMVYSKGDTAMRNNYTVPAEHKL
jgi:insulysin